MVLAADYPLLQVFFSMLWFFLFVLWIMLVFRVFADIFRSDDLGGFAKTLWILFVIFFIYLGVFVYLIARGKKMAENDMKDMQARDEAMRAYVRDAAGTSASPAEELSRLAELKSQGVIDEAEFQRMKAKIVG